MVNIILKAIVYILEDLGNARIISSRKEGKMSTAYKVVGGLKQVKPIMSVNKAESKARVLKLYKAWYKQIPHMGRHVYHKSRTCRLVTSEEIRKYYHNYGFSLFTY